jgi:hypothetical protein
MVVLRITHISQDKKNLIPTVENLSVDEQQQYRDLMNQSGRGFTPLTHQGPRGGEG